MPYSIQKRKDKFVVVNTDTGDVKGTHDSREKAQKQLNLLRAVKAGWKSSKRTIRRID